MKFDCGPPAFRGGSSWWAQRTHGAWGRGVTPRIGPASRQELRGGKEVRDDEGEKHISQPDPAPATFDDISILPLRISPLRGDGAVCPCVTGQGVAPEDAGIALLIFRAPRVSSHKITHAGGIAFRAVGVVPRLWQTWTGGIFKKRSGQLNQKRQICW